MKDKYPVFRLTADGGYIFEILVLFQAERREHCLLNNMITLHAACNMPDLKIIGSRLQVLYYTNDSN